MIEPSEIDEATVEQLALFLFTNGMQGEAPEWFKTFTLSARTHAPVWEVAHCLGDTKTSKRIWIVRGLMIEFAEARMRQMIYQEQVRLRQDGAPRIIRPV